MAATTQTEAQCSSTDVCRPSSHAESAQGSSSTPVTGPNDTAAAAEAAGAPATDTEATATPAAAGGTSLSTEEAAELQREIDDCRRQIQEVRAGTHFEVATKIRALHSLKRKRDDAAKTQHSRLVANARDLAAFDRQHAAADLDAGLSATKDGLLDGVAQEMRRCEEEARRVIRGEVEPVPHAGDLPPPPPHHHPHARRGRRGRGGGRGGENPRAAALARRAAAIAPLLPVNLCQVLVDAEVRSDFAAIISDWRERALAYLQVSGGDMGWCHVERTKAPGGETAVALDGTLIKVGDRVVVWSRLTGEEFKGELTAVVGKEVFVRLIGNIPTRLHMDHLATGRLKLKRVPR